MFFAFCSGGGALARPSNGAATYAEMLGEVPSSARYVIPIICGNDYYGSLQPLQRDVVDAALAPETTGKLRLAASDVAGINDCALGRWSNPDACERTRQPATECSLRQEDR